MIGNLFQIHVPVLELMLRGTLVYWLLFCIFRLSCGAMWAPWASPTSCCWW